MGASQSEGGEHGGEGLVLSFHGDPSLVFGPAQDLVPPCSPPRHEELLQKGGVYASMWLQQQAGDEGESKERRTEKSPGSKKGP